MGTAASEFWRLQLTKLTQFIVKPLISNKYLSIITMETLFKGSLFSACDITAWAREEMHWTSTEEKWDMRVKDRQKEAELGSQYPTLFCSYFKHINILYMK